MADVIVAAEPEVREYVLEHGERLRVGERLSG